MNVFDDMAVVHGPSLLNWALAHLGQLSDARDLVQDTFERALRARPPVADHQELRRWLFRVMRNRHLDHRRSAIVRSASDVDVDTLPEPEVEPEQRPLWKRMDLETVSSLLPALSRPLREAFMLYIAGHSGNEIARRLLIAPNTVTTRVFRARRTLRRLAESAFAEGNQAGRLSDPSAKHSGPPLRSAQRRRSKPRSLNAKVQVHVQRGAVDEEPRADAGHAG
jgi:RNA polymerase sigma-70 factor (ECF subfamily)